MYPWKGKGFPNPFLGRAKGGGREDKGESVSGLGGKHTIRRAVPSWKVFKVRVEGFWGGFYGVEDDLREDKGKVVQSPFSVEVPSFV